ncbi:MAG: type III pantothenate kinase [bacterium]
MSNLDKKNFVNLFIDVGNTHTVFGISKIINFENILLSLSDIKDFIKKIEDSLLEIRFSTNYIDTSDDIFNKISTFLNLNNVYFENNRYLINNCVVSSVVPQVNFVIEDFIKKYLKLKGGYYFLEADNDLGINWNTDNYKEMGADRVADILGSILLFKDNFIVIDFGTAITIDIIKNRTYIGGAILPGFLLNIKSLFSNTAKLPMVELKIANKLYDNTTIGQIQIGCIDIVCKGINSIISELLKDYPYFKIILTGGFSSIVKDLVIHNFVIHKLQFIGMDYYLKIKS